MHHMPPLPPLSCALNTIGLIGFGLMVIFVAGFTYAMVRITRGNQAAGRIRPGKSGPR